jgi:hypothetical protein
MALGIASERFIESRILKIVGRNKLQDIIKWNKTDLNSADDVRVIHDTSLPASKPARLELGINVVKNGLLPPRAALKIMNLDSLGDLIDEEPSEQEQRNAEYENFEMSKGDKVYPSEYENHDVHIETHVKFLTETKNLSSEDKENIFSHIDLTKDLKKLIQQGLTNQNIPVNINNMGAEQNPPQLPPPGAEQFSVGEGMNL